MKLSTLLIASVLLAHASLGQAAQSKLITNLNAGLNQTLVVYGTSLTQNGRWADVTQGRGGLHDWLTGLYGSRITMINSGMSGKASNTGVANLNTMVLTNNPDTVIIEFAINDADTHNNMSVAQSQANLNTMIDNILAARPNAEIILQTMNPAFDNGTFHYGTYRPNLAAYYQGYRDVAAARGLMLVDHYVNWTYMQTNHPSLMLTNFPDGLHPIATASIAVTVPALQKALLGSVPIPPVPTRLTATGGAAQVSLSWNVSSGAIDYNIRRSTVSGGPYTTIATGVGSTSTNYTDTGLASGRIYYYIASAVNGFGESADSAQVSATTQGGGSVPPTPTGLTATTVSSSQINLSWTASSGATSYNVKRATVSGGPYTTIAPGVTATSYSDTGLAASTTYYYVVSAVNSVGESANSAQANATTQTGGSVPPAPTGLTATTVASSQINLSWTASSGATSYNVKRATVSGGLYTTIATGVTGTTYNNTGLAASTTYYYVVSAVNSTGESPDSIEASATTQAGGGGLPSPWLTQDVGAVGVVGSATYSSGTYTVVGSGTDISRNADQFRYVYQTGGANCTITARLASMTNPNSASKAGVMIRETLATGSTETSMTVTPANGVSWQTRTTTDGTTGGSRSAGLVAPYWVRVVRSGNTFTGYMSPDGVTWTQQGTTTITMGSSVYIGLAVTSRNNTTTCTATFDNVTAAP